MVENELSGAIILVLGYALNMLPMGIHSRPGLRIVAGLAFAAIAMVTTVVDVRIFVPHVWAVTAWTFAVLILASAAMWASRSARPSKGFSSPIEVSEIAHRHRVDPSSSM